MESVIGNCTLTPRVNRLRKVLLSGVSQDSFVSSSGSALDLNFSDINVASLDKELEEQDNSLGLSSKRFQIVPVNVFSFSRVTAALTLLRRSKGAGWVGSRQHSRLPGEVLLF